MSEEYKISYPDIPYGSAILCEDIRQENNGKLLLIGAFSGDMLAHKPFPMKVPPLWLHASFSLPTAFLNKECMLQIRVVDDSGTATELVDAAIPTNTDNFGGLSGAEIHALALTANIKLPPFDLVSESVLLVAVRVDNCIYPLRSINIRSAVADDAKPDAAKSAAPAPAPSAPSA